MKQITYFCDRCGKEIDRLYKIIGHEIEKETGDFLEDVGVDLDFCSECYHEIMSDLTEIHNNDEEIEKLPFMAPELDPDPEEEEEREEVAEEEPKPKKIYDVKKMVALRKAGWSLKQISEEMGCAPQTVANHLKKEGVR